MDDTASYIFSYLYRSQGKLRCFTLAVSSYCRAGSLDRLGVSPLHGIKGQQGLQAQVQGNGEESDIDSSLDEDKGEDEGEERDKNEDDDYDDDNDIDEDSDEHIEDDEMQAQQVTPDVQARQGSNQVLAGSHAQPKANSAERRAVRVPGDDVIEAKQRELDMLEARLQRTIALFEAQQRSQHVEHGRTGEEDALAGENVILSEDQHRDVNRGEPDTQTQP